MDEPVDGGAPAPGPGDRESPLAAGLSDWPAAIHKRLRPAVEGLATDLIDLSAEIHAHPELGFREVRACGRLTDFLGRHAFRPQPGVAGLETAFRAERAFGDGGPTLAVFAEYDALPGLGHACGHNVIAAAAVGAAVAAAGEAERAGLAGRIVAIGSPGEEAGGGGKIRLLDSGVLRDVQVALMVHPADFDAPAPVAIGRTSHEVTFTGRASHASAAPEMGRNALDAATLFHVAVGLLRQQLRADARVHTNIVEGGESINVIPERARVKIFLRSPDNGYLRGHLYEAVRNCAQGAALATGTEFRFEETAPAYEPLLSNPVLAEIAARLFTAAGRRLDPAMQSAAGGSTDMGNVSQVMPGLHPYLRIAGGVQLHTREFAAAAAGPEGTRAVVDGATMLASMLVGLLQRPELVEAAWAAHARP